MAVIVKAGAKDSDRAAVQAGMRYISRADYVLLDEMARPISREDALTRYDFFRQGKDKKIAGYRVVVALPKTDTERGREIVQALMAERYHSFVQAVHPDAGNPHIHFHLAAYRYHPLSQFQSYRRELQPLGAEIERRCAAEGIKYAYAPGGVTAVKTQAEVHMVQRGIAPWKDDMRKEIKAALTGSRDFLSFQTALKSKGINITRETEKSLTLSDSAGRKVRLGRLFSSMKNRQDVVRHFSAKGPASVLPGISSFFSASPAAVPKAGVDESGDEGIDEKMTEDEKRAIRYRNRQRAIAAAQLAQAGAVKQGIAQGIPGGLRPSQGILEAVGEAKELAVQFREEKDELKLLKREEREIERERDADIAEIIADAELADRAQIEEEEEIKAREEKIEEATEKLEKSKGLVLERIVEQEAQGSDKMYEEAGNINTLVKSDADLTNAVNVNQQGPGAAQQLLQRASRVAARKPVATPTPTPSWRPGD